MSDKITFKELVEQISRQSEKSRNSTHSFIHELVQIIESGLRNNGSVSISGFGKFELRWMKERAGRNPQTGEEITIPGQNKVVFKPYKALREDVNRPYANMKPKILGGTPPETETDAKKETGDAESVEALPRESEPPPSHPPPASEKKSEIIDPDDEEWIIERPKPKSKVSKPPESEKKEPEADEKPKLNIPADADSDTKPVEKPKSFTAREQVSVSTALKEAKKTDDAGKSGGMNWSYAAAAVIIALAIMVVIYFLQQRTYEPAEIAADTQPQQQIESVEPALPSGEEESSPSPGQETAADTDHEIETISYNVQPGETLWNIAEQELGNPYLWPWIYDLNSSLLDNPNRLENGTELTIPSISVTDSVTDNQLEQIALGYLSVYEWSIQHNPDEAKYFLWAVGVFSMDVLDQAANRVDVNDLAFAKNR